MRRLMVVALVTVMAAGVANAQQAVQSTDLGFVPNYVPMGARDYDAYRESSLGNSFWPAGNYGYAGSLDDIRFGAPIHMSSFDVGWYSRITAGATPLTMKVNFYSYFTDVYNYPGYGYVGGYPFMGAKYGPTFTITGLGTGLHYGATATTVNIPGGGMYLPCSVWMEVGFFDNMGNLAVDTGMLLAADWGAEAGITSHDYFGLSSPMGFPLTLWTWFGGYTPDLPASDPNWNPASNFILGITAVPEPLTLGLVAIGGLLAVRRRR